MESQGVNIQMKATEQYFPVVLFIMPYIVVLILESVDGIPRCEHSNESYWAVLSCGTVYYAIHCGSNFRVCGWNPKVWTFKWKLLSSTFPYKCLSHVCNMSNSVLSWAKGKRFYGLILSGKNDLLCIKISCILFILRVILKDS